MSRRERADEQHSSGKGEREVRTKLSSRVQTRRAQSLMTFEGSPGSATSTSMPSHQHLRCHGSEVRAQAIWSIITHRRFPPEQQELLRGGHLVVVDRDLPLAGRVRGVHDAGFEEDERDGRYAAPRRLHCAVSPFILTVEPTAMTHRHRHTSWHTFRETRRSVRNARVDGGPGPRRTSCRACRSGAARRGCSPC